MTDIPRQLNIHGFPKTEKFQSYDEWILYAQKKLSLVKNRISIQDFLRRDQFLKTDRDRSGPEPQRISNYRNFPVDNNFPKKSKDYLNNKNQRREYGFREKVLNGYPDYSPDRIGDLDLTGKVISGFVTVGDGIFSGIPQYDDTSLDKKETRRQAEYGYGRVTGKKIIPNGLCFIQDDTAAIGIHVGSDVRFMWHPKLYSNFLSNSTVSIDSMHTGASLIPRADYRQFLRIGDFVIVEMGIRLKYWNSLLGGNSLHHWDTLYGYGELYDTVPFVDIYILGKNYKTRVDKLNKISPNEYPYESPKDSKGRSLYLKTIESTPDNLENTINKDTPAHPEVRNVIDHPWSTGTPIPVNSGMPYIMTEQFGVDSTDRREPYPKLITTRDMRDLNGDGKNRGPKLKGQLVKLKNLEIIIPCKRWSIGIDIATDKNGKQLEPGVHFSETELTAPVLKRRKTKPTYGDLGYGVAFNSVRDDLPSFPTPEHLFFTNESNEIWLPKGVNMLFDIPGEVVKKYFPETDPPELKTNFFVGNNYTQQTISSSNQYYEVSGNKDKLPEHFKNDYRYWKHKYIENFGVDYTGQKIEMFKYSRRSGPKGFPDGNEWSTKPMTQEEVDKFQNNTGRLFDTLGIYNYEGWSIPSNKSSGLINPTPFVPWGARYQFRKEGGSPGTTWYNFSQVYWGLGISDGGDATDFFDQVEDGPDRIVENSWPDLLPNYNRMGMPYYKYIKVVQPFPISIDIEDGGYWFTEPTVKINSDRTINDLSRGDPSERVHIEAHSTFINRYENYKREYVNKTSMDGCFRTYSSATDIEREKIKFLPNKVYYAVDENGIVIPIRINANTELARFRVPVPVGKFDITGILWQYSTGKPGLEWTREGYMMQIWPRFLSDVKISETVVIKPPVIPPVLPPVPPTPPSPPSKLPDLTLDIGDAGNPARLDCESVRRILDSQNQYKEEMKKRSEWPVDREYESDSKMNVHKDPQTGREILMPKNIKEVVDGMPDYPCKGMKVGEQRNVTITSQQFPGVSRTFFFTVGPNGECLCTMYQPGSEDRRINDRRDDTFGGGGQNPTTDVGGRQRNGSGGRIIG